MNLVRRRTRYTSPRQGWRVWRLGEAGGRRRKNEADLVVREGRASLYLPKGAMLATRAPVLDDIANSLMVKLKYCFKT